MKSIGRSHQRNLKSPEFFDDRETVCGRAIPDDSEIFPLAVTQFEFVEIFGAVREFQLPVAEVGTVRHSENQIPVEIFLPHRISAVILDPQQDRARFAGRGIHDERPAARHPGNEPFRLEPRQRAAQSQERHPMLPGEETLPRQFGPRRIHPGPDLVAQIFIDQIAFALRTLPLLLIPPQLVIVNVIHLN